MILRPVRPAANICWKKRTIEAAVDPAAESWANINAMDDLVGAVLTTNDRLVVSAMGGNAAAGGAMLALAADEVWCRAGAVPNPHYRLMGLYGSEYWTRTLPRRAGADVTGELMRRALPVSAAAGQRIGLVDRIVDCGPQDFPNVVARLAALLASSSGAQYRATAPISRPKLGTWPRPTSNHHQNPPPPAGLEGLRRSSQPLGWSNAPGCGPFRPVGESVGGRGREGGPLS